MPILNDGNKQILYHNYRGSDFSQATVPTNEVVQKRSTYVNINRAGTFAFLYETTASAGGLASAVKQVLTNYNSTELNNFDGVFRHSNLLSRIDNANPAILNSIARVKVYKNIRITSSSLDSHSAAFDFQLDGELTQTKSIPFFEIMFGKFCFTYLKPASPTISPKNKIFILH